MRDFPPSQPKSTSASASGCVNWWPDRGSVRIPRCRWRRNGYDFGGCGGGLGIRLPIGCFHVESRTYRYYQLLLSVPKRSWPQSTRNMRAHMELITGLFPSSTSRWIASPCSPKPSFRLSPFLGRPGRRGGRGGSPARVRKLRTATRTAFRVTAWQLNLQVSDHAGRELARNSLQYRYRLVL